MDYFKLGAVLTLKDMLSEKMDGIKGKIQGLREKLKGSADDLAYFDESMKKLKVGGALLGSGLVLASGLIAARVESSKLEANIRSLGVSAEETDKISQSTRVMAAQYGLAKETFLTGIYDIKSAVSSLDPGQLAGISEQIAKLALATKGDFAGLSDLFGVAYGQFRKMYKGMSDENFAAVFANTVSYAANVYKTDGGKMQQAMQSLGASAAANNITLEEQSAVLGRLQNTMQAGVAGTSYRAFLTTVGDAFQKLGLRATDARGQLRSMPDLLDQLKKRFGDSLDVKEQSILKKAFGSDESLSFIKELLPNAKELRSEIKTIKDLNSKGDMKFVNEASAANLDNLSNQLDRMGAGWKSFKDLIAKGFGDSFIAPLAGKVGDLFQWIQKISQESPGVARLMSALGGLVVGFTVLGGAIIAVRSGMALYNIITYHSALASGLANSASKSYALGNSILSGSFSLTTISANMFRAAQNAVNMAVRAFPLVFIVSAIAAVIVYWDDIKKVVDKAINSLKQWSVVWAGIKEAMGMKLDAGEKLALDLTKANLSLQAMKDRQDVLKKAGGESLAEYKQLTNQMKQLEGSISQMQSLDARRTAAGSTLDQVKDKIAALKAASGTVEGASKQVLEDKLKAYTNVRDQMQTALDAGQYNIAAKLGDKSALDKIEQSGVKLAQTFASGVSKGKASVDVAVRDITSSIGRQLPQSDAKEGPLSNLTYRGRALVSTFGEGIEIEGRNNDAAAQFVKQTARKINPDSPVMQAIGQAKGGSSMNFASMFGNVNFSLGGKEMSREETARAMTDFFMGMLQQAEA
ncbi:MAG: phage tail tape measure protein [Spirochaetes bacterium]|nr:phage tail tape measure protein [Spirochaetota bacterium]